ncbi:hypothetical protein [Cytobacillus purgationiresistens]|uniref:YhjD n=1 Tax=Cytobacillus purgationiresistens TaxID=863449 RepID=A0ABU0ABA2_9BACI|nr:hypothetical protein [Cytobacillus purgationiresistens]MDQ0268531.1 hypothetical protein [Cytobacillus purgationiresistens]
MTRIPEIDRDIIEQAMYLPMVVVILERDRQIIEKAHLKLNTPYLNLMEETIKAVRHDLKIVKEKMRSGHMTVHEISRDKDFTNYLFIYKGYEEQHNYFNPRIRNKVNELLEYYLYKRFLA